MLRAGHGPARAKVRLPESACHSLKQHAFKRSVRASRYFEKVLRQTPQCADATAQSQQKVLVMRNVTYCYRLSYSVAERKASSRQPEPRSSPASSSPAPGSGAIRQLFQYAAMRAAGRSQTLPRRRPTAQHTFYTDKAGLPHLGHVIADQPDALPPRRCALSWLPITRIVRPAAAPGSRPARPHANYRTSP
jgi:hypothetical protein